MLANVFDGKQLVSELLKATFLSIVIAVMMFLIVIPPLVIENARNPRSQYSNALGLSDSQAAYQEATMISKERWTVTRCLPLIVPGPSMPVRSIEVLLVDASRTKRLALTLEEIHPLYRVLHAAESGDQVKFGLLDYALRVKQKGGSLSFLDVHIVGVDKVF